MNGKLERFIDTSERALRQHNLYIPPVVGVNETQRDSQIIRENCIAAVGTIIVGDEKHSVRNGPRTDVPESFVTDGVRATLRSLDLDAIPKPYNSKEVPNRGTTGRLLNLNGKLERQLEPWIEARVMNDKGSIPTCLNSGRRHLRLSRLGRRRC